jgi:hypothetical protein
MPQIPAHLCGGKMTFQFDARLEMPEISEILARRGLQAGGAVQQFIDSEVIRYCDPKVPFRTGALKDSALIASVIGEGIVVYATPYARRMYYNPKFNFNGAPERGAFWFPRMLAEHKDDILRGAAAIAGGNAE